MFDLVPASFHMAFSWLGMASTGAPIGFHGVEWEWYFRTFLDHFSTLWGMVFALQMPFLAEWFKQVESFTAAREWGTKLSVVGVAVAATAVWAYYVYSMPKFDYNHNHCYFSIVPLLAYLLLRNISVTLWSYHLHGLSWLGAITLETYLLQYHIWLSGNAAKLLNIVPGYPILTFVLASAMHIFCATQVFRITNELRSIVLPNEVGAALKNLAMVTVAIAVCCFGAHYFVSAGLGVVHLLSWIVILGVAVQGYIVAGMPQVQMDIFRKMEKEQTAGSKQTIFLCIFVAAALAITFIP